MSLDRMLAVVLGGLVLAGVSGCGNPKYAKVSGIVLLDGKPYPNAVVSFQPMATEDNPTPGRGSSAYTDENGRFTLKMEDGQEGAVVGKHRVRIMTRTDTGPIDPKLGSPDRPPSGKSKAHVDPIPPEWYATGSKEFDVPPGGTADAEFSIETKKK